MPSLVKPELAVVVQPERDVSLLQVLRGLLELAHLLPAYLLRDLDEDVRNLCVEDLLRDEGVDLIFLTSHEALDPIELEQSCLE